EHRANAGRTAIAAIAALQQLDRAGEQFAATPVQRLGLADAAGEVVVQPERWREAFRLAPGRLAVDAAPLAAAVRVRLREPGAVAGADGAGEVAGLGHRR